MADALAKKSNEAKSAQQAQKPSRELARQPAPTSPYGNVLALQRSAGNHAVSHLLGRAQGTSPSGGAALQRKCACGNAAKAGGECEECSQKKRLNLQTKLKVNEPGDVYEQEADRIADQVMARPAQSGISDAPPHIQRFSGQTNGSVAEAPASVEQTLASPGRPLEPALRQDMEQRFGYDFSRVRVHLGAVAEQSARDVNAHAYVVEHNVVFGAGRYHPETYDGQELIAHELTHIVQQSNHAYPMLHRKEENNSILAAIQGLPMYELLPRLINLSEDLLNDEDAGRLIGGPRLVIAMRAVRAKLERDIDFLINNKTDLQSLPPDQYVDIINFLATPDERKSEKTVNKDLEVDITIVSPSSIRLPGEQQFTQSEISIDQPPSPPEAISDFEENLLNDRTLINGVVLDPDTGEIIGYRPAGGTTGLQKLVDREGNIAFETELGLETPVLDPIDIAPNPASLAKGAAKAGVGILGKVAVKGALKKGATSGGKITLGAINEMRGVAKNLAKSGGLKLSKRLGRALMRPKVIKSIRATAEIDERLVADVIQARTQLWRAGEAFGSHNIAAVKISVGGKTRILVARSTVKELHSEARLIKQIEDIVAKEGDVEVLQVLSERIPCTRAGCLQGINAKYPKADIFYFVAEELKPLGTKTAKALEIAYGLRP
jgi:hypothetical protein